MKKYINIKHTPLILIFLVFFSMFILSFHACHALSVVEGISCAQTAAPGQNVPPCKLNEFLKIAVNVSQIILGLVGVLSLFAFIYGGVMFLVSGGSSERVTKAKQILLSAILGLVIVFTSYMIISFALGAMGYSSSEWTGGILKF